ncbi:GntR family transcriptional regulator [Yoonia sediminilitoris]|uniref:GntR family transcriptional regulator n=1 Tax=Yoonia sediminilitoris TaxID=1286148 RepID=A0A2T6KQX9_9RHOB|nr:GntR family transcriptional regulator [Yoonia sediminilitoris]PUB18968.1 GntR family transcriptional regulator [Yoonia sediminilitoris]RCW99136.1 GntR family transcriptional regulator [Yoonia sediminilitoris]
MDTIKPKRTLVEETYDRLVDAICNGELSPGVRLNQDEIAAKLNVSRQPVNSAISILKISGLVEDTGRRSVVVKLFDPGLFRAIYEYRRVIEPFAVRLAGPVLSDRQRAQADKIIAAGQKAIQRGDLRLLVCADMQFHEMIYGWCGNQVIETSMKTNWHHIRRSMAEVLREPDAVQSVWDQHSEIIDALFQKENEKAAQIMEQHIDHAYASVTQAMDMHLDQDLGVR